jgi:hypothetical protein
LIMEVDYVRVTSSSDIQATAFRKMPSLLTLFLVLHQPIEDECQNYRQEQGNSQTLLRPSLASEAKQMKHVITLSSLHKGIIPW